MSVTISQSTADRVILRNVSWATYESLLKDLENSSAPRLAYDRGVLEIMSPHVGHEEVSRTLALIVEIAFEEIGADYINAGSTTFKKEDQERGFEPDSSFYIQHVRNVRGKKKLDISVDPPPDLLIEVHLTRNSFNKFSLYAALGVPEVWRFEDSLEIWLLSQGTYVRQVVSRAIAVLDEKLVSQLVESSLTQQRPIWLRETRQQIRLLL